MKTEGKVPGKFIKLYERLRGMKVPYRITFIIIGIASTIWFLVRVIPKPTRAGYPCMRIAAPFMSGFVLYLLSLAGSALLFRRARRFFYRSRYLLAATAFLGALVVLAVSSNLFPERAQAAVDKADPSDFPPNMPMGEELGIFPGRVVWEWDRDATDEDCTNTFNDPVRGEDGFFMIQNNNQEVINRMMDNIVMKLTGTYNTGAAWDQLFIDFNKRKGLGEVSYEDGQTIFIKINQGTASWQTNSDLTRIENAWNQSSYGIAETTPAMAISVLDQLINDFGVPQENIYIGDPMSHIFQDVYEEMASLFPDVHYVDRQRTDLGRTLITATTEGAIKWSDKGQVMTSAHTDYLYAEMVHADYLINLAALKAHARAGVTLTAKNHFGSHTRGDDGAWHLHDGLVCYINNDVLSPARTEYGVYRVLTDLMGHEKLGANTVLFIMEGLWGGPEATEKPVKWNSAPFNGDWPNSILGSQDAVALESVCFDLLKTEFDNPNEPGKDRPWYGGVDDHLHQAADSKNWPAGIIYDPEGDGTPMGSMGVHEHWNNAVDKQYSRNLGYDYGIELIGPASLVGNAVNALEAETAPVIDGDASDACWDEAQWYEIDQTWITWGEEIDSTDFFGRFKASWSESQNLVYCFVEITDDAFVDGYVFPNDGYYNFDIVEVFLDPDASGGVHRLDENAFAYHLAVNAPADGETTTSYHACDLGSDWAIRDYAGHFPQLAMKKIGNRYCYEFSLAVYQDTYDHADPEASRVSLTGDREMGLSLAYCDNDAPDGARDNFFGSVWVPQAEFNSHWENADGFGRIRLTSSGSTVNHAVEVSGSIADYEITELDTDLVVHDNLQGVFTDPDGDALTYTVDCDEACLTFSVNDNALIVRASASFDGAAEVTVTASDGEFDAGVTFQVTSNITGIPQETAAAEFRAYPNPVTGLLHLEFNLESGHTGQGVIQVYNLAGTRCFVEHQTGLSGGVGTATMDLADLPGGSYIVQVRAGGGVHALMVHKK
ncbi:MAG TPA: DUF362 domain-containing protein [Bacteroides sp.]|nr:DUF362 domain-containing protein [Bacteroides sp.]